MLSGKLWPAHPKPLPDELLSSWIVRIAEANGVKLETMTHLLFGLYLLPWNRDIDRLAPKWLLKGICAHTGTPYWDAYRTTLAGYRTRLYPHRQDSGQLRWILPVKINSTKRYGYGMQYCPACLATDKEPYFRRKWRVAFHTFCPEHRIMLHDCCPACGAAITFYRRDFGRGIDEAGEICLCYQCQFDLCAAPHEPVTIYDDDSFQLYVEMLQALGGAARDAGQFNLKFHAVVHQLCKVMLSVGNHDQFRQYIAKRLGVEPAPALRKKIPFEQRRIFDRHQMVSFALWLLAAPEERIRGGWEAKAVRFNLLLKDFSGAPRWFADLAGRLNRMQFPELYVRDRSRVGRIA